MARRGYPRICAEAKRQKAEIYRGDEMGLRLDHLSGTTYGRKGRPPVIPATGKRFGCNMVSAITNRGSLMFMVFRRRFTHEVFREFLRRYVRQTKGKTFLILDKHPVHVSAPIRRWLNAHERQLACDFGKIDYVVRDGHVVLFDLNPTPAFSALATNHLSDKVARHLAEGIGSVLGSSSA